MNQLKIIVFHKNDQALFNYFLNYWHDDSAWNFILACRENYCGVETWLQLI